MAKRFLRFLDATGAAHEEAEDLVATEQVVTVGDDGRKVGYQLLLEIQRLSNGLFGLLGRKSICQPKVDAGQLIAV